MRNEEIEFLNAFGISINQDNRPLDENGNPVKRTKREHPYNYDAFVTWETYGYTVNGSVYSDRIHDKKLEKEIFGDTGDWWGNRNPDDIELFLQRFNNDSSIKLVKILEGANQATGYPYWWFLFHYDN